MRKNQGWAVETHIAGQVRANRRPWGKMMRHMAHRRDLLTLCMSWQQNINSDAHANIGVNAVRTAESGELGKVAHPDRKVGK